MRSRLAESLPEVYLTNLVSAGDDSNVCAQELAERRQQYMMIWSYSQWNMTAEKIRRTYLLLCCRLLDGPCSLEDLHTTWRARQRHAPQNGNTSCGRHDKKKKNGMFHMISHDLFMSRGFRLSNYVTMSSSRRRVASFNTPSEIFVIYVQYHTWHEHVYQEDRQTVI